MDQVRIAVLVSGGGTNLQAILDAEKSGIIKSGKVSVVISNRKDAYALERARNAGVEALSLSKKKLGSQEAFDRELIKLLEDREIDLIVMAGFFAIVTPEFTGRYPKRIINIHPSLIPSFSGDGFYGLRVHEAALRRGVKLTGATVHYVNDITDGGEIIAQKAVPVEDGDTPEILQRRVMEQAEWQIFPAAVEQVSRRILQERQQ